MDKEVLVRWTSVVLLVLSAAACSAQSGGQDSEVNVRCYSHISRMTANTLTCTTAGDDDGGEDDDEEEEDQIAEMTACCYDMSKDKRVCWSSQPESQGHVITGLEPLTAKFHLTVHLKTGGHLSKTLGELDKIVKPHTPQANITFPSGSNKVVVHVSTPYEEDYLTPYNQLFELHIWSSTEYQTFNMTSHPLVVEREWQQNTLYQVKVRAIPNSEIKGTWSDWSPTVSSYCNACIPAYTPASSGAEPLRGQVLLYVLTVTLVMLFLATWGAVFLWRRKIHTYVWPDIPHPKQTFVQIYKPVKAIPVSFNPEAFLDLAVYPVEERVGDVTDGVPTTVPSAPHPSAPRPTPRPASSGSINLCSDKLSTMMTQQQPDSRPPSMTLDGVGVPPGDQGGPPSLLGGVGDPPGGQGGPPSLLDIGVPPGGQGGSHDLEQPYTLKSQSDDPQRAGSKDEAYVTMSSFYHIK